MTRNQAKGDGTIDTDTLPRKTDQEALDTKHRRQTLVELLAWAVQEGHGFETVVDIAWELGLEEELGELLDSSPERQSAYLAELKAQFLELDPQLDEPVDGGAERQ